MEPFNEVLQHAVMGRWNTFDDDQKRATIAWLCGHSPATVVRAMDYAARLAEEVDETLRG